MPIRYSSVVGGSSGTGFNLDVGASGNTTFYFDTPQPAGGYSITSQLADSSIEFYAIAEDGTLAGYTNTKAMSATKDFDTLVVYGATTNDLITFEYKATTLPTASGDQDSGAAPFITSISDADLASIDDTTIITGGNFATDVVVTFTGTDAVVRNAKSVVRTNSTQLIVTRPDDFLEDNSPYTLTVSNPGITQSAIVTNTSSITAGAGPVWSTASGALPSGIAQVAYSTTLVASDPEGSAITYAISSGSLPSGLSLNSSTGEITGTASAEGTSNFVIEATDGGGNLANRSFSLSLNSPISGGTVTEDGGYRYHTFTSSDTFTTNIDIQNAEYLVVAGGGGGGGYGGGGGAGGYRSSAAGVLSGASSLAESAITITSGSYAIEVGAGGAPGISTAGYTSGDNGSPSKIGTLIESLGGGGGGHYNSNPGLSGGSGGGGGTGEANTTSIISSGGTGTSSQGTDGGGGRGRPSSTYWGAGGGGGAASSAPDAPASTTGGAGGDGLTWVNGVSYGGGGGGSSNVSGGAGGLGGGGNGSIQAGPVYNGDPNTGGGGGGGRNTPYIGAGGSGIVIIRYPV